MDPHQTLGVPPGSPPEVVERAFRVAAQQFHPNNGGTREQFAQIVAAYNALKATTPPIPQQQAPVPPSRPSPPNQRYVITPRIHGTPDTNRKSVLAARVVAASAAATVAAISGLAFSGGTLTLLTVIITAVAFAGAAAAGPAIVMAAYIPATRLLLVAAAAGLALWPTVVGAVVAIAAAAGIRVILKKVRLI
jgi:hypothetical protein